MATNVHDLCVQQEITLEQLAERSGLRRTYIRELERGLKSPTLAAVTSMADALGKKSHQLVKAAEDLA